MSKLRSGILLLTLFGLAGLSTGCDQEPTPSLYKPDETGKPTPVITEIQPANNSLAGIGEITIIGENFSSTVEENIVFFGGTRAEVVSSTTTELVVKSPNVPQDSLAVKVAVQGAYLFSNTLYYNLLPAVLEYGKFGDFDDNYALAVDKDENLYVSLKGRRLVKVSPGADEFEDFARTLSDKASGMKVGPDGGIYYVNVLGFVFKVEADGSKDGLYARLPGRAYDLDFGPNGNLYCGGGGKAIYRVRPDKTSEVAADYGELSIVTIRVYDGYVYVGGTDATTNEASIWRNKINSADELGPNELYFNWTEKIGSQAELLSLTFDEDGVMYVGTTTPDPIYKIFPDGSFEPLYPGVLEPNTYAMAWGNGNHMYVSRRNSDLQKKRVMIINMQKKSAPYYGRD